MADDRHARISEEAYRLWKTEGEPHGRDREHWEQAERAFAGEGPAVEQPDPQTDDEAATAGADATDVTADSGAAEAASSEAASSDAIPDEAPAPAAAARPAAKKPAARRKRTT